MPFCPECREEYVEGTHVCPDCHAELIDALPPEGEVEMVDWQILQGVPNEVVGCILKGVLESCNIKVYLRSLTIPGYNGIIGSWFKSYWGELLVPRDYLEEAREIVDEYMASIEDGETNETHFQNQP